jgi:peptidoglycan/xylan/chitin deacetylase (PgdA/CDA1 family)
MMKKNEGEPSIMIKKLTICLLLALMLTACAQGSVQNTPPVSEPPAQQSGGDVEVPDEGDEPTEVEEEQPDATEDPDEPAAPPEPEEPEYTYYMNKIYDIKPLDESAEAKVVLLTFDDGPKSADMLNPLLETLEKHGAKAIFFVNGFRVKANPELLQLIHDKGHAIGNHSWDHIPLNKESEETIRQQVDDVQQIVEETIGEKPLFFRPPHGASNEFLRNYVKEQGMLFMTWSNGSLDWEKGHQTAEAVITNVFKQLRPGSNILMHELPWTVEAMDELLTKLAEEGYSFVDPHKIQIETPEEGQSS